MLGPILLEKHQECSRIEGARLGNLFISRQGLRANTPAISLHQLDPIRIQSVSISNSPRCTQGQSAVASVHEGNLHDCLTLTQHASQSDALTQTQSVAPS